MLRMDRLKPADNGRTPARSALQHDGAGIVLIMKSEDPLRGLLTHEANEASLTFLQLPLVEDPLLGSSATSKGATLCVLACSQLRSPVAGQMW